MIRIPTANKIRQIIGKSNKTNFRDNFLVLKGYNQIIDSSRNEFLTFFYPKKMKVILVYIPTLRKMKFPLKSGMYYCFVPSKGTRSSKKETFSDEQHSKERTRS